MLEPCSQSLNAAEWSPIRPCVIATCAEDGHVYIYDLAVRVFEMILLIVQTNSTVPFTHFLASQEEGVSLTRLAFNSVKPDYLATGDANGFLKIWRLSSFLSERIGGEERVLEQLCGS